jgi:alkanesulfonate monooxygenase SsuD/methylene tetrahydromethanopterin reductase-like flavin-dependent oxidoreductase (luciferase family)
MPIPLSVLISPHCGGAPPRWPCATAWTSRVASSGGWGYHQFRLAEHHGMPGVASAATAVVIGHVAAGTSRIRVNRGGIMRPNHAPLVILEQFGTFA